MVDGGWIEVDVEGGEMMVCMVCMVCVRCDVYGGLACVWGPDPRPLAGATTLSINNQPIAPHNPSTFSSLDPSIMHPPLLDSGQLSFTFPAPHPIGIKHALICLLYLLSLRL